MRIHRWALVGSMLALLAPPARAQEVSFHGQVRPRYEFRDPVGGGTDEFTSMRVRAALSAALEDGLTVFIQVQDVRLWGSEGSTLGDFSADNFDLHQGYLRYEGQELEWLTATLGRMETAFGGQRLVGTVGWTQQGRSFDGIRLDAAGDRASVALVAYTLQDATSAAHDSDAELYGAYGTLRGVGPGALDAYLLWDRGEGVAETSQKTLGARYAFTGSVTGRFEGSLQTGSRSGTAVSAYMLGARLGTDFGGGPITGTLWYDYLSGDSDPDDNEAGAFSTLYATNHKFYGFADLFLDIPTHTGQRGLQDMAVKLVWAPNATTSLGVDLHSFSAAEQGSLSTSHFANEVDVTLSHRYTPHLGATVGASFVFEDDALAEIGRLSERMTWFYVMFDASF